MQNEATAKLPYIRHWHEKRSIKAKEKFIGFYYFVVQKNTFIGRNRMSNSKEVP